MTRKEQIIEVLKKHIGECAISGDDADYLLFHLTKDILSLPIDVPSEEEIEEYAQKEIDRQRSGFVAMNNEMPITLNVWLNTLKHSKRITAKWAINEILKRNKIE